MLVWAEVEICIYKEGVLFYHGRKKELIKYQNCHISPIEIEDVAMQHSDIMDIGVYGFPDEKVHIDLANNIDVFFN